MICCAVCAPDVYKRQAVDKTDTPVGYILCSKDYQAYQARFRKSYLPLIQARSISHKVAFLVVVIQAAKEGVDGPLVLPYGGLDVPTSGQVVVDGKALSKLKDEELTVFRRRKIGFIFQNYNLVPVLNVYENIVLPVELDGNKVDKRCV